MLGTQVKRSSPQQRQSTTDPSSVLSIRLSAAETEEVVQAAKAAGLRRGDFLKSALKAHLDAGGPERTVNSDRDVLVQIAALRLAMANLFALLPGVALDHVLLVLAHADEQAAKAF